jgi:hypothetical protein
MTVEIVLIGLLVGAIVLMLQRWFWLLVFGISALASCFAMLASIVHFQILGALFFFFLTWACWAITGAIAAGYNKPEPSPFNR